MDPFTHCYSARVDTRWRLGVALFQQMKIPVEPLQLISPSKDSQWLVIFNPASGASRNRFDQAELIHHLRNAGIDFLLQKARAFGDAEQMASRAYAAGWRKFVIAGGDGTANQVINGLLAERSPEPDDLTLAILPIGTGNDWSRSLGISRKLRQACATLANGCLVASDVGQVTYWNQGQQNTRYFLNLCGAGIDAHVVQSVASRRPGRWQYFAGLVHAARGFRTVPIEVKTPDWCQCAPTLTILVCNGGFLGGGMRIAPQARFDDGLFDVIVVEDMGFAGVITHIPRLLFGSLSRSRRVRVLQTASLEIGGNTPIQCDGELLGVTPARICIIPAAFRVMVDPRQRRS